jgi:transcriptional regulator with XRE-family HTH domain
LPLSEFRDFLEAAAKKLGSKRKLAQAINLSPGRLSRVLGGEHSFTIARCFALAKVTGDSPAHVLRVAGKSKLADLIEEAYGPNPSGVNPAERTLIKQWDALEPQDRVHMEWMLTRLIEKRGEQRRSTERGRFRAHDVSRRPRKDPRPRQRKPPA